MDAYQARLAQKAEVDFDDMIVMAEDCIRSGRYRSPHTVLLVDEFQDISVARARLVNALLTQRPDATLLAVGDARQAIYRFAGSDVSVFRNFEQHFGFTRRLALTRTFRFGQGLAEISNAFCDAGVTPAFSEDPARDRVVDVRLYSGPSAAPALVRSVLDEIALEATSTARGRASVLVLYRMNRVGAALGDLGAGRAALAVGKMSIHRSKGLEADYVILAGVTAASAGQFPCKVADDTLLQLVLPQIEPELAEERRLMYVALTRARRRAYVVASASEPSEFIAMLAKADAGQGRVFLRSEVGTPARGCQLCKRGFIVPRRGPHGAFLGCSTYPDCRFTERLEPVGRSTPRRAANRR
jgi:DNA helicase-4